MANPALAPGALAKPLKGEYALDRKATRRDRVRDEQKAMKAALRRDGGKCRYPRCAFPTLKVDPCHEIHRGMGGNPTGDRTKRHLLIALCRRHHDEWDKGLIEIHPLTEFGMDDCCSFHRVSEAGRMELVALEQRLGVSEART